MRGIEMNEEMVCGQLRSIDVRMCFFSAWALASRFWGTRDDFLIARHCGTTLSLLTFGREDLRKSDIVTVYIALYTIVVLAYRYVR
jgi:hypothetical protein